MPITPHMPPRLLLLMMLGSVVAFGPLSIDMYLPAIPTLAEEFDVGEPVIQFSLTAFLLGMALGQLVYGPLSDRFGRKPLLYVGLSLYCAATVACALAPTAHLLILARVVEALGACAGMVISRAVIRDLYTPHEAAGIFSLLMLVTGVAPVLAPLAGGYVSVWLGWRAIFWMLAALSIATLVLMVLSLPETHRRENQRSLRESFLGYGELLRHRQFMGYALAGGVAQAGMFAYITGSAFVYIELFHVPAEHFGWFFGVNAIGLIGMAQVNVLLLRRHSLDCILRKSFVALMGVGLFLLSTSLLHLGLWATAFGIFCYMGVLGMTFPNAAAGALAEQARRAGSASAMMGSLQVGAGVCASALVNLLHNHTSLPMTGVMVVCGSVALVAYRVMIGKTHAVDCRPQVHEVELHDENLAAIPTPRLE